MRRTLGLCRRADHSYASAKRRGGDCGRGKAGALREGDEAAGDGATKMSGRGTSSNGDCGGERQLGSTGAVHVVRSDACGTERGVEGGSRDGGAAGAVWQAAASFARLARRSRSSSSTQWGCGQQ